MKARDVSLAYSLVPVALVVCCMAGLSRAATDSPPAVGLTPPLDVSVSGPPDVIRNLSAGDFVVTLNGKVTPVASAEAQCQLDASKPLRSSTQFFIYFNQNALSPYSRERAIQTAKTLVPTLVAAGEVAIVADGTRLRMLVPPTSDRAALIRALEKLEQDENRLEVKSKITQNRDQFADPDPSGRLAAMMSAFSVFGPPKVVLYFSDSWIGRLLEEGSSPKRAAAFGGFRIHAIATESRFGGVKLNAEEKFMITDTRDKTGRSGTLVQTNSFSEVAKSDRAMANIAAESGGILFDSFATAASIADQSLQKESCLYRLRFERSRVQADAELVTSLKSKKKAVKVYARASWYAPTPEMISERRFVGTLSAPLDHLEKPGLVVQVIPTGFKSGRYTGLVQLRLDAETVGGSAWEFAARGFAKAKLDEIEAKGLANATSIETFRWRVLVPGSADPLGYEAEETFSEGPYEVVAVARNTETGEITARRVEGSMPIVHGTRVSISPVVVMQSGPCRCHRRLDDLRVAEANAGAFALGPGEPVLTGHAVLLVTLVCRGDRDATKFRVVSSVSGGTDEAMRLFEADLESEGCIQLRDKIVEDKLKPGLYTYQVRVLADGKEIDTAKRLFVVAAPNSP